jgi:hypothetical protein
MEDEPQNSLIISLPAIEYIDKTKKTIDEKIAAKCTEWQMGLSALRKEWELEHKNLIQRYEESEKAKSLAKIEVDKHFENINSLQNRMDKLSDTFVTKDAFETEIEGRMKNIWTTLSAISLVLIGTFIAHIFGKV